VEFDPEMVERINKYIEAKGVAKGKKTIADVVRHAVDIFLEENEF